MPQGHYCSAFGVWYQGSRKQHTNKMAGRASKSGDAYRTEKKLEEKYDEQEALGTPTCVIDWINGVLAGDVASALSLDDAKRGSSWEAIAAYLKDGVILCMLINKLRLAAGLSKQSFQKKAKTPFVAMQNVENFNQAAKEYGVPETALFQTTDITDGRKASMVNVLNCLSQLGFVANTKGYEPKFTPPGAPKADF
ncbi:hypothetical protein CAPTEDRAFT_221625 [Capitella teleta]|uniref:Calponin-homology (CH) domain-containing protein n=1 Tax=Capitella teleta TaxID=283909 RepID=R7UJL5_CAPTE|nr:hypothetical protein CAPTEDRAFT_221625 [Capitella teleta]|eukprot:ELU06754.1 hypothetical protein CAPTEDRAFT_221625 [Capitella teleta]